MNLTGEDYYKIGILFYIGELTGTKNMTRGLNYLQQAISAGYGKAYDLILKSTMVTHRSKIQNPFAFELAAIEIGSFRAYHELSVLKNRKAFGRNVSPDVDKEINTALQNYTYSEKRQKQLYTLLNSQIKISFDTTYDAKNKSASECFTQALKYYTGEETGKQNTTKGREWLLAAKDKGSTRAEELAYKPYTPLYATIESAKDGDIYAINKITDLHHGGFLKDIVPDAELVEMAKKIVALGDIY